MPKRLEGEKVIYGGCSEIGLMGAGPDSRIAGGGLSPQKKHSFIIALPMKKRPFLHHKERGKGGSRAKSRPGGGLNLRVGMTEALATLWPAGKDSWGVGERVSTIGNHLTRSKEKR